MTGYMFVLGHCWSCGRLFTFNPHHVPSIPVLPDGTIGGGPGATREPLCATCIGIANERRKATGMPLWHVHADAYEPTEEL